MSEASYIPDVLAHALAAEAAWQATDQGKHPRIHKRLSLDYWQARSELAQQYPSIETWLFEAVGVHLGERLRRRDELARLLKEAIEHV